MNHVKRAIIMAAGRGKRMRPLTDTTPKPLIPVNGRPMIETIIDGLHMQGITEIYVVVSYLKEKFTYLPLKYKNLKLITNPYAAKYNNISSLYVAREHLQDVMILDGDQLINDPQVLQPEFRYSGYNGTWCEGHTTEWLLNVNDQNIITHCSRNGGDHGYRLYSVSRWNAADGQKLKHYLEVEFKKGNTDIYWDDVAIFCYPHKFILGVYSMSQNAVQEIDNVHQLSEIDPAYCKYIMKSGLQNE